MPDLPSDELFGALRDAVGRLREQVQSLEERISRLETAAERQRPDMLPGAAVSRPPRPVSSPSDDRPTADTEEILEAELVAADLVENEGDTAPTAGSPFTLSDEKLATVHSAARDERGDERTRLSGSSGSLFPQFDFEKPVDWEAFVGGKLLTWVGAAIVIIAIAFAIPWAWKYFDTPDWVKVAGFHALGIGFLAAGHYLDRRRPELRMLAAGLAGLGIFTLYGIAFSALHHYKIWGEHATFVECSVITLLAIAISLRANSVTIILLGALGGYLTPLVASTGSGEYVGWFLYLAFLNVALISTAVIRGWSFLKPLTWAATALMFQLWFHDQTNFIDWYDEKLWPTQWLVTLHFAIFLLGATLPPIVWKRRSTQLDLTALVGGSMWFVAATWYLFHDRADQQLALVSWGMAALHLGLFAATYHRLSNADRMPRVQLALSAIFFTLAAPLQLDDPAYLSVAWCVEGLVFAAVCVYFRDRQLGISALIVFALAGVRLAVDFVGAPRMLEGTSIDFRFMITACGGLLAMAAGSLFLLLPKLIDRDRATGVVDPFEKISGTVLVVLGNLAMLLSLTRQWDNRLVLLVWLVVTAAVWLVGFRRDWPMIRWYAAFLAVVLVGGRAIWHGDDVAAPFALITNTRFASLALVAALYLIAGWVYHGCQLATGRAKSSTWADSAGEIPFNESICDPLFGILGNVVLLAAISMEIHSWYGPVLSTGYSAFGRITMVEQATYSIAWAVYAAMLVGIGFALRYRLYRWLGLCGFAFVVGKVFLVDLSELELFPRVLAFAVLGLMLLGVSFLYQKFTRRIEGGG